MTDTFYIPKKGIRCPNHNEPLDSISREDLRKGKGNGRCPVSGAMFAFEADTENFTKDKFGNLVASVKLSGHEN